MHFSCVFDNVTVF